MIKNIIFDMGGVLIDYDPEKTLYGLFDKKTADTALKEIFRNELWRERDRGTVTSDMIMELAGPSIPAGAYNKVNELTHNLYPYMKPFPEMERLIKKLKSNGFGIYLLSNASDDFYLNKGAIPALSLFDGYLISSDWYMLKPEREIYEKLYERFNLKPSECLFIDDLEENVEGAEAAGMHAYCYADCNIKRLEKELKKLGIL